MKTQNLFRAISLAILCTFLSLPVGAQSPNESGYAAFRTAFKAKFFEQISWKKTKLISQETATPQYPAINPDEVRPLLTATSNRKPTDLKLLKFYPTMSRKELTIVWRQSASTKVHIELTDVTGQSVLLTEVTEFPAGKNELRTDLSNLLPGLYSCELHVGEETIQQSLMIIQ